MLYVPDGLLANCIDAIRVLANPLEKHRAHITVRGPYQRAMSSLDAINRDIEGSGIDIDGSGNFFGSGQNTVYLACKSPQLEAVWYKRDYGFNPHITLYDGQSHEFARKLWDIVSSRTYETSFVAGPLKALVSSRKHQGGMALQADLDLNLLHEVAELDTDAGVVDNLGEEARLVAIGKLCDYLSNIDSGQILPPRHGAMRKKGKEYEVTVVDINSEALSSIKTLAKKNSATLGFLPDGAFDAYAKRGWVLAAASNGEMVGYVVYRVSRMRAVLVHLCTDERYRGQGVAEHLFRSVVDRTSGLHGILANTRRDFPAHNMWPRLGFAAVGERPGRGTNPSVLTQWWYEYPQPTLFSGNSSYARAQSPIDVAIDLNVFYDLMMPSLREEADESRSLQGDWLVDEIQLCVTPELFNEINRLDSPKTREEQRIVAHEFKRISGPVEEFDRTCSLLSSIMGEAKNERQSSDMRHLAHTAAAGVEFFITRDAKMMKFSNEIENSTGVTVMRPVDLVIEIDHVRNIASYQPVRLSGSLLQIAKIDREQREQLEDIFINRSIGEKKRAFRRKVSSILLSRAATESGTVSYDGKPVALFGFELSEPDVLTVPCLRLRSGPMARTLARAIVTKALDSSVLEGRSVTAVTDEWLEPFVEEALAESGFAKLGDQWLKLNYRAIGTESESSTGLELLLERLEGSGLKLPTILRFPLREGYLSTAAETVLVEKQLRPLKITNGILDTLVIPVRPRWAQHLFDSVLAEQTLFGARPDLVLSWENAYYRAPRSLGEISTPFRILWYVSQDKRYMGTRQIRAYSVGSSVEVLPAQDAYNRYKRLGVYDMREVLCIAGGKRDGQVMVIRFCDTEVFENPIDSKRFRETLETSDQKKPSLRGPQRISETAFAKIYSEGQCLS